MADASMPRRSDNLQRLIDSADQSVSLLASLDTWSGAPRSSTSSASLSGIAQQPMSTESFYFTSPPASNDRVDPASYDDLNVVDLAVQRGLLHVKGVFPDHSVEYVDIDPRFSTIDDLKRALCDKRNVRKDLGFTSTEARIMFNGQLVENDWLVVDCGLSIDGVIYVVKGLPTPSGLFGGGAGIKPAMADSRLPVASIASSYARPQTQNQLARREEDSVLLEFHHSLALDATQSGQLTQKVRPEEANFAEMLSDFYQNLGQVQDTDAYGERLLRGYIEVLQTRLEVLESSVEGSNRFASQQRQRLQATIDELRDERNTWRLLYDLRQICSQSDEADDTLMELAENPDELRFDMVEDDALRVLETRNDTYKIQKAVKTWLENMAVENAVNVSDRRDVAKHGSRTLKMLKRGLLDRGNIRMDPDAVLQIGDRHIVEDDAEDEADLLRGVWSHIRAGNLQDAVELCVRVGEPWRAASLSGGIPVGASEANDDNTLERWGNPLRALWKTTCWKFAEGKTPKMSKRNSMLARQYEEIVYAGLSGHVQVLVQSSLCDSWEDHCWAYMQALTEMHIDEQLHKLLKVKLQSSQLIVGNDAHYLRLFRDLLDKTKHLKRYQVNLDALFDDLRSSKSETIRKQANEPHRVIQAKLITAKIDVIIANIAAALDAAKRAEEGFDWSLHLDEHVAADEVTPFFLRFGAHFVLFASFTEEKMDEAASHLIVKAYIRHLVKHGHQKLVPIYASRLPVEGAVDIYVQILSRLDDRSQRESFMRRVLEFSSLDVLTTVVSITVEQLSAKYLQQARPVKTSADTTTALDRQRMRVIEYLCFFNEHRAEALRRANLLAREFVVEGKFSAVKELFVEHVPEDSVGLVNLHHSSQTIDDEDEIERILRGHLCWKAYIRAANHYHLWRSCTAGRGIVSTSTYSEEKDFLTELMYHVARTASALVDVLQFENGWMLHCSDDKDEDLAVRQACLPLLVHQLHFIQLESAKLVLRLEYYPTDAKAQLVQPLLEKSLQVADVVADEHYAVSDALSPHHCQELLNGFRESAIALLHLESMMPLEELDIDGNEDEVNLALESDPSAE